MANKSSVRPLISGGKTLSLMYQGKKPSGHSKPKCKATWFVDGLGRVFDRPMACQSWPQNEVPELVLEIRSRSK